MRSLVIPIVLMPILLVGNLSAQAASVTSRAGLGNQNGNQHCVAPRIGQPWVPVVSCYVGSTVGLAGFVGTANTPFQNQTVLVDLNSAVVLQTHLTFSPAAPAVSFVHQFPNDPGLIGVQFSTQAFEIFVVPQVGLQITLTNACDHVVGT